MLCVLVLLTAIPAGAMECIEALPLSEEVPDPFLFLEGHRVASREAWGKRRAELVGLVQKYEYGHMPPPPGNVRRAEVTAPEEIFGKTAKRRRIRLCFGPEEQLGMTTEIYWPVQGTGPYPVIVRFGMDDSKLLPLIERGYAYACFEHEELDPDTEGSDVAGPAQAAYPGYDWGSLAVWAWGASRVLDYLETVPEIDAGKSVITGHSRTGKAALLAGALDERFAIVVPNGSGCGGAALFRHRSKGAETLSFITLPSRFKSWFHAGFGRFGKQEGRLPFDQHCLRALVAPRVVLSTDGLDDHWANPGGTQAAWMAAQPVFDFLGAAENNLCHFRRGGHDQNEEDYQVLLDVADWRFHGKAIPRDFAARPQPNLKAAWSWTRPDIP